MAAKRGTGPRVKPIEVISEMAPEGIPEAPAVAALPPIAMVSAGSLRDGEEFECEGERYRKLCVMAGKVVALHLTNPERGWIGVAQKAFGGDAMVIKK